MFDISFVYLVIFLMVFTCGAGTFCCAVYNMFKFMYFRKIEDITVCDEDTNQEYVHIRYDIDGQKHEKLFETSLINGSLYYNKKKPDELVNLHFELSDLYALGACTVIFAILLKFVGWLI